MRASVVVSILALVSFLASVDSAAAQQSAAQTSVPHLVQFSGVLKDAAARPVVGVTSVTFAIYADQEGGAALWSETQNVLADSNGHYATVLGVATTGGFPTELFGTGQSRWLGVTIAREPESPRILMASVPYALKAGDAETLGGLPASSYVTTQQLAASNARPATTFINGGGATTAASTQGVTTASADSAQQSSAIEANPTGSGTTDYVPLWTSGSNLGNSVLFQTGGKLGVGTTSPAATLDINGGEILRGGFYEYPEDNATATNGGRPSHSFQWLASVFNSSTNAAVDYAYGFRAVQQGNNTATPSANLDLFYGTGGPSGTINDTGLSITPTGVINFVPTQAFNGSTINLPNSIGATVGTLQMGGAPFLADYGSTSNTFVGALSGGAGQSTGAENTAVGGESLAANGPGAYNTALGYGAMQANISGGGNVAAGVNALSVNTYGDDNAAFGEIALGLNTTGSQNVGVGVAALVSNTTGGYNVGIGYGSGAVSATGSGNTFLGSNTRATDGINNSTAIGTGASVTESNAIVLGYTGSPRPAVGIGTTAPSHTLDVIDRGTGGAAIYASSSFVADTAVFGISTATSESGSNGGFFQTSSPLGSGVVGQNIAGGYGGFFYSAGGTAGYFSGNVTVTGTLSKGAGSFKIDDPIDPANKYLSHSFVESPDMMNIYNGNVVTDAHGFATVKMPDWFEALNRDFRYQLTTINSFSRATIAAELKDGKFRIRTSQPHVKVSWLVTGIRHDAYADAHRIPTEEVKPPSEQGHYLHPELFGEGPDKSVVAGATTATAPLNGGH